MKELKNICMNESKNKNMTEWNNDTEWMKNEKKKTLGTRGIKSILDEEGKTTIRIAKELEFWCG